MFRHFFTDVYTVIPRMQAQNKLNVTYVTHQYDTAFTMFNMSV